MNFIQSSSPLAVCLFRHQKRDRNRLRPSGKNDSICIISSSIFIALAQRTLLESNNPRLTYRCRIIIVSTQKGQ